MYPHDERDLNTALHQGDTLIAACDRLIRLAQELQEDARMAEVAWMERYT